MQIKEVRIENMRNLKKVEEPLFRRTAVEGKNHIGKSNSIQAIYWLLTGYLLDNSADDMSLKPADAPRSEVSVEITTDDGKKLKKTYCEKWTRRRNSGTETLTGHETAYALNGSTLKAAEASDEILGILFGMRMKEALGKPVDLVRTMVNPLYLFGQCDWKSARQFIIGLVGEVKDEDVFAKHPSLEKIKEDLDSFGGRTDLLSKSYSERGKSLAKDIATQQTIIDLAQRKIQDNQVSDQEYADAQKTVEAIRAGREKIKAEKTANPLADSIRSKIRHQNDILSTLLSTVNEEEDAYLKEYTEARSKAQEAYTQCLKEYSDAVNAKTEASSKTESIEANIRKAEASVTELESQRTALLDRWKEVKAQEFHADESKCPNCGYVLNQAEIEQKKLEFENGRNGKLLDITNQGKTIATELSRRKAQLDQYRRQLADAQNMDGGTDYDSAISMAAKSRDAALAFLNSIKPKQSQARSQIAAVRGEIDQLNRELREAENSVLATDEERLRQYDAANRNELDKANETISKKAVFEDAKKDVASAATAKAAFNKQVMQNDELHELLKQFILKKLGMVNESTKKVFPDIEFVLIKQNIKEGSFDEVCYPLIKGKKTPFADGSNSEKILTGIAIIEDIRRYLALPDIPIIFDEGETLDSESLASIPTESQIITSVVNDKYIAPTFVNLEAEGR